MGLGDSFRRGCANATEIAGRREKGLRDWAYREWEFAKVGLGNFTICLAPIRMVFLGGGICIYDDFGAGSI